MRLIVFFTTLLLLLPSAAQSSRLILVSVDGLMPRTLRNADQLALRIPNLKEFRDKGAVADGLISVLPTVTYPSHTTMVTGRNPADHGIIANQLFDPGREMNGAWFWYSELIKTPTLWEVAKARGLTTAAVSWPVTVGAQIDFNIPEYRFPHTAEDVFRQRAAITPGLVHEYEKRHGPLKLEGERFDKMRGELASFIIATRRPHLLLVHLADFDHDQHLKGPEHPDALRTLETTDAIIGGLRKAVAEAGLERETRWMIVSDHGFYPVEKAFHFEAFLESLGLAAEAGKPGTWRVASHANAGSVAFVARDPDDREAQARLLSMLEHLQAAGDWGIDRILKRDDLRAMGGYPHAFAAVSLARGWTSGSSRSGRWAGPSGRTRGTHGYAPGPPEMDATFVVYGPGIQPSQLPRAHLIDVARTAAALLQLEIPSAGGRNLLAAP